MGKLEFLDALKRAMTGLAPELQAKTLGFYDQRFVDGAAEGRSEEEIAKEFDDPRKIAMTLRANTHMQAFQAKKDPASFGRMLFAGIGLAIFNLFMVVPAMVYFSLLMALYACGLAFYLGGAVVTASGLSGANEIRLDGPLRNVIVLDDEEGHRGGDKQTKVSISETGIEIYSEPNEATPARSPAVTVTVDEDVPRAVNRAAATAAAEAKAAAAEAKAAAAEVAAVSAVAAQAAQAAGEAAGEAAGKAAEAAGEAAGKAAEAAGEAADAAGEAAAAAGEAAQAAGDGIDEDDSKRSVRVIKRAESVASNGIVLSTGDDDNSRATQTVIGLMMVVGGIILLLLSLVITRYTFIGIKRYFDMNLSLLRGH